MFKNKSNEYENDNLMTDGRDSNINEDANSEENKKSNDKNSMNYIAGVFSGLMLALIIVVCAYIGKVVSGNNGSNNTGVSGGESISSDADFDTLVSKEKLLLQIMQNYYYYDVDMSAVEEAVCDGLLEALGDKYAQYYTKEEYAEILEKNSGSYCGIGVVVDQDPDTKIITVVTPYENAPGAKAGIKAGDIIVGVDGNDISGMDLSSVVALIKGEEGTKISVTVMRGEEELTFEMERAVIKIDSIAYEKIDDIAYIYIDSFEDKTPEEFKKALDKAANDGAKGIIFDLRNNPGGSLDSVVAMLDYIIDDGLLVYIEDKNGNRQEYNATSENSLNIPMVCLVNQYSASASELFTGTLKEYDKAVIVGVTTYGKGVVQTLRPLTDGSAFKFTTSKYFIKGGINIDGIGITPDVEVELNEDAVGSDGVIIREKDEQFKTAKEELKKLIEK